MYDIRRLILLRDLAEHTTMRAVSELHGITTSAVSQQLRILEEEVGAVLMRREGRVLRLTHAGRVLVDHTVRVVAALEEAESAVAATDAAVTGVLTLATFRTALPQLALPAAARLRAEYPGLRVRLVTLMPVDSVPAVRQQDVDLAVTYSYSFRVRDLPLGLGSEFLMNDPLVLLAPPALRDPVRQHGLSAVRDADWIAARDGAPSIVSVIFACREAGFAPRIQHRGGSFAAMAEMVDHGLGVTIVPEMSVDDRHRHLIASAITGGLRRVGVTYRQASLERPAVAAAVAALRGVAGDERLAS
ncbi:DNA-binding transcriptional LysR family regulator [Nocardia transvalensis]|uniref:DNA-binding transcriptional LysR family regulator n=1 Tax=Nocardia transvalensis TaxID=37333 RepID=A0A7W9PH55_9NOCA|nr:LysR family transcriptional regulator [Nocardia transvalensis]MBB5916106.1 DNA-binding transcriptional LysR family regulator [Nocardia transvalensis]